MRAQSKQLNHIIYYNFDYMFDFILNRKSINGKCYYLYSFDYDPSNNEQLFTFFRNYFQSILGRDFSYVDFYDEKYSPNFTRIEKGLKKLEGRYKSQIHLALYDQDTRENKNGLYLQFNLGKTVRLCVVVSDQFNIDFTDLCRQYSKWTNILYGFRYDVDVNYFAFSFGIGDAQRTIKASNIIRSTQDDIWRWVNNSNKIQDGFFRDVLPENILTTKHLENRINGATIQEVIAEQKLGRVLQISEGLFHWELDKEQLKRARAILYSSEYMI